MYAELYLIKKIQSYRIKNLQGNNICETSYIKKIYFAAEPVGTGADGSEIEMQFTENYYQLHEIFKIELTGQQCFVTSRPVRKSDRCWSVMVRLLDDDYSSVLDTDGCHVGDATKFIGNAKPELHDCGEITLPQSAIIIFIV